MRSQGLRVLLSGLVLIFLAGNSSRSAALVTAAPAATAPDDIADSFFKTLQRGSASTDAYAALLSDLVKRKPDDLANLANQTDSALKLYGPITSFEQVSESKLGSMIVKRVYVTQHDVAPLFWTMFFYKGAKGWKVAFVVFDDKIQDRL